MVNPKVVVKGGPRSPGKKNTFKELQDAQTIPTQIVRQPQPPRMPQLKRPLTGKQLDELNARLPMMPDEYKGTTMHVEIQKPVIMPDP